MNNDDSEKMNTVVKPYNKTEKKKEVEQMFDNIAHSYDFLNHFFSFGIDLYWRKKALRLLQREQVEYLLDVASGTGDFALAAKKMGVGKKKIIGVDISEKMLEKGRKKIAKKGWSESIILKKGDSEYLPFSANEFDALTVAFGVRNFEHLDKGLSEMYRVLKPQATAVVLEFSKPSAFPVKQIFQFYFKYVMPFLGKLISRDNRAYAYLEESVQAFPEGEKFLIKMQEAGFHDTKWHALSGGIASIYLGKK